MAQGTELPGGYAEAAFSARADTTEAFLAAVMQRLPSRPDLRILDLGCGTGDVTLALSRERPDDVIVGLDISSSNVAVAKQRQASHGSAARVEFVAADYRQWASAPFDVIVSDSVLHLIPGEDAALAAKLAADLVPQGMLIATMPDVCARNSALLLQRRLWRATPKALDKLALNLAARVHRREQAHILADRIGYLRMLPERIHDPKFVAAMRAAGLADVEASIWPGASLLKLSHKLIVWTKR